MMIESTTNNTKIGNTESLWTKPYVRFKYRTNKGTKNLPRDSYLFDRTRNSNDTVVKNVRSVEGKTE